MKSIVVGAMLLRTMNAQVPAGNVVPALDAPALGAPALGAPSLGTPSLGTPALGAPALGAPAVGAPSLGAPSLGAPSLGAPSLGAPALGVPSLGTPSLGAPAGDLPAVGVPSPRVPALLPIKDTLAPVITPGINAPSEAELLGPIAPIAPLLVEPSFPLPIGTADVVLPQPSSAAPFGVGTRPGSAISTPATGFIWPTRPAFPSAPSAVADTLRSLGPAVPSQLNPLRSAIGAIASSLPAASSRGSSFGAFAVPGEANPPADIIPPVDVTEPIPAPPVDVTDPIPVPPVDGPVPVAAPVDNTAPLPVIDGAIVPPVAPIVPGSPDWNPTADPAGIARPIGSNPYVGPYDPNSVYDPNSPYYDPYAQPPGWEGNDNGIYDGEDDDDDYQGGKGPGYGDDDDYEECPAWCLHEDDSYDSYDSYDPYPTPDYDYSPYKPTPTPEYPKYSPVADPYPEYKETPEYDPYPQEPTYKEAPYPAPTPDYEEDPQYYPEPEDKPYPQLKKVRSILRAVRRQFYSWGQPAYSDDDDSSSYDGEDGSIPDWLYDISGAPKRPTPAPKPKCPKSCHKPKKDDYGYGYKPERPTYTKTRKGGYKTTADPYEPTKAPYGQGNSTVYWPTGPTSVPDGPTSIPDDSTSIPDEPTSIPDEPTSIPSEPTTTYYEPTTLVTQYQPQPYPAETGYGSSDPGYSSSDPGSPAGDYTGDTLDTLCPNTCNPFNPAENFCDITTGCTTTGGSKYYCACRAGFRADNYNAKDFSKQFKVAGQPYVYLAVSTSCNTPCSDQTCSEVLERDQCK